MGRVDNATMTCHRSVSDDGPEASKEQDHFMVLSYWFPVTGFQLLVPIFWFPVTGFQLLAPYVFALGNKSGSFCEAVN